MTEKTAEKQNDFVLMIEKLSEIQSKIALGKDLKGYGYQYRNAEQILTAVKPLLNGATVICSDELKDGGLLVATATIYYKTAFLSVQGFAFLSEHKGMSREQIIGCASSYARKYALQGLLAVADGADDPDGLQPEKTVKQPEKQPENKAEKVYQRAFDALKKLDSVSKMLVNKAEMAKKMPEYKAEIDKAYNDAVAELDALNHNNELAAQSHNDDCPF